MPFSQGDIVNVKSGGPALTVLSVEGEHVTCLFFSEELGEFRQAVIPSFALEAFDDDEGDHHERHAADDDDEEDDEDVHKAA
ncbi:MAG: DUF2158 domain-containing protein [Hyphomicrobiales bacterium]|nr:DUF2158 domain-containing protein [Hyphomicrobiales bacterium]